MQQEYQEQERKRITRMRSMMDISRGIVFSLIGLFFIFFDKFKVEGVEFQPWYRYLGGLFIVYGAWRLYRGLKKDYFR